MMRKIPATVITGFLGAGKTSLLRHLVAHANGRRLALVINEFGELASIARSSWVAALRTAARTT